MFSLLQYASTSCFPESKTFTFIEFSFEVLEANPFSKKAGMHFITVRERYLHFKLEKSSSFVFCFVLLLSVALTVNATEKASYRK